MSVTKEACELYNVREPGGEWATIALRCWDRPANVGTPHEGTYYCGEIMINSSFGAWGQIWTACAEPFKQFLLDAEFDYVFTKFMGSSLHRFDGEKSFRDLLRRLLMARRSDDLRKQAARELWVALHDVEEEAKCSENDWVSALNAVGDEIIRGYGPSSSAARFLREPWELIRHSYDVQASRFWETLWPEFVAALREEVA